MANRKITVLNPAGYQELFQSGDNLVVDGSVNLQSNGLTGVPAPSVNLDAANKGYVDTADAALDSRLTTLEGASAGIIPAEDSQIDITGSAGITVTGGTFTLNQSNDSTINIEGPDLSSFLNKPTTDGVFVITRTSGIISYTTTVDGGTY